MLRRACYIHVGPHKTGTTSIQLFLKESRAELLKHDYFVPESGNIHGGHHAIVRSLCGQQVPSHQQSVATQFIQALEETSSAAIVISSEALDELLTRRAYARTFFNRIREFHLEPNIVAFPRNQAQSINSRYATVVKGFRSCQPFETFVQAEARHPSFRYSRLIALADEFGAKLIARPFTGETLICGVIPQFLQAIGIDPLQFPNPSGRHNVAVGPFTVAVARHLLRSTANPDKQLTWLQAERCKKTLTAYLEQKGWADSDYCGLTPVLTQRIEKESRADNDAFALRVWGRPWSEIFAADIGREFVPNDFDVCQPDWFTARRLERATRELQTIVDEILHDPALTAEEPWNDLLQRSGLVSPEQAFDERS
jgi:hypothetical protein